jgi:predicted DNA binding CopG/RHH family protein
MKKEIYTDAPKSVEAALDEAQVIDDFLPPPEQLIRRSKKEKITITLDSTAVRFFKTEAKRQNTKYQTMINEVVSRYAEQYLQKK